MRAWQSWVLLGSSFAVLSGCGGGGRPDLEKFVVEYVRSVNEGSEFYKRYTPPERLDDVEEDRLRMTGDFKFTHWDYRGGGTYEYVLEFSNGARGIAMVSERDGRIRATLSVFARGS